MEVEKKDFGLAEQQPLPKFKDNEKVLCFHGPLIYEGKALKHEYRNSEKEYAYWIHYSGWSKKWDAWVYERRVLKHTMENLEKQHSLKAAHDETMRLAKSKSAGKNVSKKKSLGSDTSSVNNMSTTDSRSSTPVQDQKTSKGGVEPEPSRGRKKQFECVETEAHFMVKQEVQIVIPDTLKTILVDDWDYVTRQKRLFKLPARISINQIFADYLKAKTKSEKKAGELVHGLRQYFNTLIGTQLLYGIEQDQYIKFAIEKQKQTPKTALVDMTEYYGAPHLIRLFTKLGGCLTYTNLDPQAIETLRTCIDEFLTFIANHCPEYFSFDDYARVSVDLATEEMVM